VVRAGRAIVVVGDALLDHDLEGDVERLCPDAPVPVVDAVEERSRPGGAGLAAVLSAADGRSVVLVTALGRDGAGAALARLLEAAGVELVDLGLRGPTPEKTRVRAAGRSLMRIDRGGRAARVGPWTSEAQEALAGAGAVVVADYGRGVASEPGLRDALAALPPRLPVVWDPHPRGSVPVPGVRLATPNRQEAAHLAPDAAGDGLAGHAARGRALLERWRAAAVAVTLGEGGALLVTGEVPPLLVPAPPAVGDPCGAGDRFATAAAGSLADGALPSEAVIAAVHASSSFVAAGGASALAASTLEPRAGGDDPSPPVDAQSLAEAVRRRGGTVVATGGCFDLLHAGHVSTLQSARALGDCLIVCLNSDASVRRLKGGGRPVVPEADRAAVLLGLACVDAVAVFDEDTPVELLARLRPDVFAKGADYSVADLPEGSLLSTWGGQAVVLPFLEGRSTSQLVEELAAGGSG
jgi:D-beta-D-heptose 7-phosphate kinase/D-beta-D-heptose 1-phosphate adenosyltransferase